MSLIFAGPDLKRKRGDAFMVRMLWHLCVVCMVDRMCASRHKQKDVETLCLFVVLHQALSESRRSLAQSFQKLQASSAAGNWWDRLLHSFAETR